MIYDKHISGLRLQPVGRNALDVHLTGQFVQRGLPPSDMKVWKYEIARSDGRRGSGVRSSHIDTAFDNIVMDVNTRMLGVYF